MTPEAKAHPACPRCDGPVALAARDAAGRISCPGCGARLRLRRTRPGPVPRPAVAVPARRPPGEPLVNPVRRQVRLCRVLAVLFVGSGLAFVPLVGDPG